MKAYTFNISLSILNHLGRNLYRSFITVLGEAISNSWDADATEVYININREKNILVIKDNGDGMTSDDFQNKFLKIGYSKRKDNATKTKNNRPFIGRKGIGKLALLSCAKKVTILSKTETSNLIGGIIDNSGLDKAILNDVSASKYKLGTPSKKIIEGYAKNLDKGTVIIFEDLNDGIKNRIDYIRKLIALYFRFSLIDNSFNIYLNGDPIQLTELNELNSNTQLLWIINDIKDPYLSDLLTKENLKRNENIEIKEPYIKGFIASVEKPSMLKIIGSDEKVSVDLFVNGRLREKNILRHIPTARIAESYIYGQIHFDSLDDDIDRFTSSREGVVSDDPKYLNMLNETEIILKKIINKWDEWRVELKQDGDAENNRITPKERKSNELYNVISKDFIPTKTDNKIKKKVEEWVSELQSDAAFNFESYGECFISENLLRKYIIQQNIPLNDKIKERISNLKKKNEKAKEAANISFNIRKNKNDLSYLDMTELTSIAENIPNGHMEKASLYRDANEYKPIRDAMAHTSQLTQVAKNRLNATYENIKARIISLLTNF